MAGMGEALRELTAKYDVARVSGFAEIPGGYWVQCDKGEFSFIYDAEKRGEADVPLLPWRSKRKFTEMAGILAAGTVKTPLAIRVKNIQKESPLGGGLLSVLLREIDVCEQLLAGDPIVRLFSVPDEKHAYVNCLCATAGGVKISMELGLSPALEGPVEMHEIVCRSGIISDVAVDTQTVQYPIYVYGRTGTAVLADTDFELYGMEETKRDCVRFMLHALAGAPDALRADAARQLRLARLALKGGMCS